MSEFDIAVEYVLGNEGENFGITLRFLREIPEERLRRYGIFKGLGEYVIEELVRDQAKLIYKGEFWEGNNFDQIQHQGVCNYLFDMAVDHGIATAIKFAQRAICAVFSREYLRDDGILGASTIEAINFIGEALLPVLIGIRAEFYRSLASTRVDYLDSWLDRCYGKI